jgi:hypothetical protein
MPEGEAGGHRADRDGAGRSDDPATTALAAPCFLDERVGIRLSIRGENLVPELTERGHRSASMMAINSSWR